LFVFDVYALLISAAVFFTGRKCERIGMDDLLFIFSIKSA